MFKIELKLRKGWMRVGVYQTFVSATRAFWAFCETDGHALDIRILEGDQPVRLHYAGE